MSDEKPTHANIIVVVAARSNHKIVKVLPCTLFGVIYHGSIDENSRRKDYSGYGVFTSLSPSGGRYMHQLLGE